MSYIGNIVAFINHKIEHGFGGIEVYNFKDNPDLTMRELIDFVYSFRDRRPYSFVIPYWLGLLAGYGFDVLTLITRKKLPISSVRVRKFCATTSFNSDKLVENGFKPPFTLKEGLKRTIETEFSSA